MMNRREMFSISNENEDLVTNTAIFNVQLEHRNQHGKTEQASDQRHFGEHLSSLECLLNIEDR